jgi:hypothetical protein
MPAKTQHLGTGRPAGSLRISGSSKGLISKCRAVLPDPQLHHGLGQRDIELFDFHAQPTLFECASPTTIACREFSIA